MSDNNNLKLNKSQWNMLTRAISLLSISVVVCFGFLIIYGLLCFVSHYSSVLLPPVVAIVLAMIFKPYYFWLYKRLWHSRTLAIIGVFASILIPLCAFIYIFGVLLVEEFVKLITALPGYANDFYAYIKETAPVLMNFMERNGVDRLLTKVDFTKYIDIDAGASTIGGATISFGGHVLNFFGGLLSWLVLPVYMAIFLSSRPYNGKDVSNALIFMSKKNRDNIAYLIDRFFSIIVVYFRAQVLVAIIQGLLFSVLFHLLGLKYGLVIGMSLGLLNVVPYLGNILGWLIIIPLSLFGPGGGVALLIKIILAFCAVQTLDSYFITPRIMKDRTGLNTFVIIFSLFFWSSVIGGVLGMLLAIPLSAFIVVLWRLVKKEYFSDGNVVDEAVEPSEETSPPSIEEEK